MRASPKHSLKTTHTLRDGFREATAAAAKTAGSEDAEPLSRPPITMCADSDPGSSGIAERWSAVSDGGEDQGAEEAFMGQKKAKNHHVSFEESRLVRAALPFQRA